MTGAGRNWKVRVKGVDGSFPARGEFPLPPTSWRGMVVMLRDGAWWASLAVEMPSRRLAGHTNIEVEMDLIDEFAAIKNGDTGECLPALRSKTFRDVRKIRPKLRGLQLYQLRMP